METPQLKLYIWSGFGEPHRWGVAWAIARSVEQAWKLVKARYGANPTFGGCLEAYDLDTLRAGILFKPPDV